MVKIWKAKETTVQIADAVTTVNQTALLDGQTFANDNQFEGLLKSVTITDPEGAIDQQDFLGVDANGFQNAALHEKPFGMAKISGTLVVPSIYDTSVIPFELNAYGDGTSTPTVSSTHTRWQSGDNNRAACSILVNIVSGATYEVIVLLNNAFITKLGDRKISGPDGQWEMEFEAICLPKDYYVEIKGTGS